MTLSVACLGIALGCGARTDTLFDEDTGLAGYGAGGQPHGGGAATAGNVGVSGRGNSAGGFGTSGSFGTGGTFSAGGSFGTGGSATAGSFGVGGAVPVGGFGGFGAVSGSVSTGGSAPTAGSFGAGGFGAVGGEAGAGGTGGIVDICLGAAQNACDKCLCTSCGAQLNACFTDIGCALIFACVQQKQCQGFGCYQNSTCRGIIDQFGGPTGAPIAEVFSLGVCTFTTRGGCGCN